MFSKNVKRLIILKKTIYHGVYIFVVQYRSMSGWVRILFFAQQVDNYIQCHIIRVNFHVFFEFVETPLVSSDRCSVCSSNVPCNLSKVNAVKEVGQIQALQILCL